MSNNEKLRIAVWDYVNEKTQNGEALDVNCVAIALSSKHPQSGITISEICAQIETALKANGIETRPAAE